MHLFIDTNVYLTFYHFGSDALEELEKLSVAVKSKKINLYVPIQVSYEFKKRRETRISDALKKFNEQKMPSAFPQIYRTYEEYQELRKSIRQFAEAKKKIIDKLNKDIEDNNLDADKLIKELFENAKTIDFSDEILARADRRARLGHPPGKNNSCGDAFNWECLLNAMPEGKDLHLVSGDKDYISEVNKTRLKQFLLEEWRKKKKSKVLFFTCLSDFFKEKLPDIRLDEELRKRTAIEDLINSGSFMNTHRAIENLSDFSYFSEEEIMEILEGALSNAQIYAISRDEDVRDFFTDFIRSNETRIDPGLLIRSRNVYMPEGSNEINNEDIPSYRH